MGPYRRTPKQAARAIRYSRFRCPLSVVLVDFFVDYCFRRCLSFFHLIPLSTPKVFRQKSPVSHIWPSMFFLTTEEFQAAKGVSHNSEKICESTTELAKRFKDLKKQFFLVKNPHVSITKRSL